jgi:hypothetical protein
MTWTRSTACRRRTPTMCGTFRKSGPCALRTPWTCPEATVRPVLTTSCGWYEFARVRYLYILTFIRKCTRALTLRMCGRCTSARLIKLTATLKRIRLNTIASPRRRGGIQASKFVSTRCSTTSKCMIASCVSPKLSSPLDPLHGNM